MGGAALRIGAVELQEAKRDSLPIRNAMVRYADCLLAQVVQSSLQRCAPDRATLAPAGS